VAQERGQHRRDLFMRCSLLGGGFEVNSFVGIISVSTHLDEGERKLSITEVTYVRRDIFLLT